VIEDNNSHYQLIPGTDGSLATSKYDFFHDASVHAASLPEQWKNIMLALSAAITDLYAIPRRSGDILRINVGLESL